MGILRRSSDPLFGGAHQLRAMSRRPFIAASGLLLNFGSWPVTFIVGQDWRVAISGENGDGRGGKPWPSLRVLDHQHDYTPLGGRGPMRRHLPPDWRKQPDMTWSVSMNAADLSIVLDTRFSGTHVRAVDDRYLVTQNEDELAGWIATGHFPPGTSGASARVFEAVMSSLPRRYRNR